MTTLQPPDPAGWVTTGVDLETRRVRVLWGLAALGRTAEQRQFQARYQEFMEIDQALANGYVQARYQHIIISLTTPGWPQRSDAPHRRRDPQPSEHRTSMEVDSVNRTQTDDNTCDELEAAADPLPIILGWKVAHMLDQACVNGDWPPSGPRAGRATGWCLAVGHQRGASWRRDVVIVVRASRGREGVWLSLSPQSGCGDTHGLLRSLKQSADRPLPE